MRFNPTPGPSPTGRGGAPFGASSADTPLPDLSGEGPGVGLMRQKCFRAHLFPPKVNERRLPPYEKQISPTGFSRCLRHETARLVPPRFLAGLLVYLRLYL